MFIELTNKRVRKERKDILIHSGKDKGPPLCVVTEARLERYPMRGTGTLFHFSVPSTDYGSGIYSVKCCWMNEWIHISVPLIFLTRLLPAQGPYFQKNSSIFGHVWLVKRFWDYPFWKPLPPKILILLSHAALSPTNPLGKGIGKQIAL